MILRQLIGFRPLELVGNARRSFRYHLAFALLDGASAGILSNAGLIAVKGLAAEDWQLGIRLPLSSFGMFAALMLGS